MVDEDAAGDGMPQDDLLTIDEAAAFLDTSKSTLYRLIGVGAVRGTKVGKQWRFRKGDLIAYLERTPEPVTVAESARGDLEAEIAFFAGQIAQAGGKVGDAQPDAGARSTLDLREAGVTPPRRLAYGIVRFSLDSRASDLHLERTEDALRLRFRVDGALHEIRRMPATLADALVATFKEMADMNTAERRVPQDGRIPVKRGDREYDFRVSCIPVLHGEDVVIKILDRSAVLLGLERLGIAEGPLAALRSAIRRPSGLVIASGPTGSGKTTLLYSCLREIVTDGVKCVSAEDPVEVKLPNVSQAQIAPRLGLTFASAMRAFLRQDPDVIYCSEIRDRETIEHAVVAALTGHMVFTALHTENAPSAIARLTDMGVEPYLVSATLSCVAALRLARRLCPECKTPAAPDEIAPTVERLKTLSEYGGYAIPAGATFFEPAGCPACRSTGFRGRIGLHEILSLTPRLTQELMRAGSEDETTRIAVAHGMRTLLADGVAKAVEGETALDEVLRATGTWL